MSAHENEESPKEIKELPGKVVADNTADDTGTESPGGEVSKRKPGRPLGAKNKDTLFKEMMTGRFQETAVNNIEKVYNVLFEKAHAGDMKAIKLVLDRVVPVTKAVDLADMEKKGLTINISVGAMEEAEREDIEIGEYEVVPDGTEVMNDGRE